MASSSDGAPTVGASKDVSPEFKVKLEITWDKNEDDNEDAETCSENEEETIRQILQHELRELQDFFKEIRMGQLVRIEKDLHFVCRLSSKAEYDEWYTNKKKLEKYIMKNYSENIKGRLNLSSEFEIDATIEHISKEDENRLKKFFKPRRSASTSSSLQAVTLPTNPTVRQPSGDTAPSTPSPDDTSRQGTRDPPKTAVSSGIEDTPSGVDKNLASPAADAKPSIGAEGGNNESSSQQDSHEPSERGSSVDSAGKGHVEESIPTTTASTRQDSGARSAPSSKYGQDPTSREDLSKEKRSQLQTFRVFICSDDDVALKKVHIKVEKEKKREMRRENQNAAGSLWVTELCSEDVLNRTYTYMCTYDLSMTEKLGKFFRVTSDVATHKTALRCSKTANLYDFFSVKADDKKCRADFLIWCAITFGFSENGVAGVNYCLNDGGMSNPSAVVNLFWTYWKKYTFLEICHAVTMFLILLKGNISRNIKSSGDFLDTLKANWKEILLSLSGIPDNFRQCHVARVTEMAEAVWSLNLDDNNLLFLLDLVFDMRVPEIKESAIKAADRYLSNVRPPLNFSPEWTQREQHGLMDVCCKLMQSAERDVAQRVVEQIVRKCPVHLLYNVQEQLNKGSQVPADLEKIIHEEIQSKVQEKIKHCLQTRSVRDISKVLEDLEQRELLDEFLKEFISCVQNLLETSRFGDGSTELVLLVKQVIFKAGLQSQKALLKAICTNSNPSIHLTFIDLLQTGVCKDYSHEDLDRAVSTWMDTALKMYGSEKGVMRIYQCLDDAIAVLKTRQTSDRTQKELLQAVHSHVEKSDVFYIIKEWYLNEHQLSPQIEAEFLRQVSRLLQTAAKFSSDTRPALQSLLRDIGASRGILDINTRFQADLISQCICIFEIDKNLDDVNSFIRIIRNFEFWHLILRARGEYAKEVHKHAAVQTAMEVVKTVSETLRRRTLSRHDAEQLIGEKIRIEEASKLAASENLGTSDCLKACYQDLCCIETILAQTLETEQLMQRIPSVISRKIKNSQVLLKMLGDRKAQVVNLLQNELYRTFLDHRVEFSDLSTLSTSTVFQKLAQAIFKESETAGELSASFVCQHLRKGIELYRGFWQPLFDGRDVAPNDIEEILCAGDIESEINTAEKVFRKKLDTVSRNGIVLAHQQKDYAVVLHILPLIGCETSRNDTSVGALEKFVALDLTAADMRLHQVTEAGKALQELNLHELKHHHIEVINELDKGQAVVTFLQEDIRGDDLRDWIEAVEENTEQFVPVSTVSSFIQVQSFVQRIFQDGAQSHQAAAVIKRLRDSIEEFSHLGEKIRDCSTNLNGLRNLFLSMANKDEITRDIVRVICDAASSCLEFVSTEGHCCCKLLYDSKGEQRFQTLESLLDHKSRALLMTHSVSKEDSALPKPEKDKADFDQFVVCIEKACRIKQAMENLWQAGHPDYLDGVERRITIEKLPSELEVLTTKLQVWNARVNECREKYPNLNFFFPRQLWTLWSYFKNGKTNREECLQLLKLAGFDTEQGTIRGGKICAAAKKARERFSSESREKTDAFEAVGIALQHIAGMADFKPKVFPKNILGDTLELSKMTDTVKEGELFIAALDENSTQTLPTLLSLYRNTTNAFPLPHQVLFCHEGTIWEEIELLLMRCLGAARPGSRKDLTELPGGSGLPGKYDEGEACKEQLFCLVHVEKLPNELQFRLVDRVTKFCEEEFKYFAMICRGTRRHPFLDHFAEVVNHVQPMSPTAMEHCFRELWPDVVVVSSELPGQGKTEVIRTGASKRKRQMATLHISGDFSEEKVLKSFVEMNLSADHSIHIDLGWISDPRQFDILVFGIVILGCVTFRDRVFLLPTTDIKIEIANTINSILLNSLQLTPCFKRFRLEWDNFAGFTISDEINSEEQVVCLYLNDAKDIGNEDLHFSGKDAVKPLSPTECRSILQKIFSSRHPKAASDMSYSSVHLFIAVLADQLKKLSCSQFMSVEGLKLMVGEDKIREIRTSFVRALVDIAHDFSVRSVSACRAKQAAALAMKESGLDDDATMIGSTAPVATASAMTKRVDSMIRWSDSNHLIIVFHNQDTQTMSALYRDVKLVKRGVKDLFETQMKKNLPDFRDMKQSELQKILQLVARSKPELLSEEKLKALSKSYALTPDNLLKMILVVLRVQSGIPVVIMGETGCGKTSLIRYLAKICSIPISVKNIHAGTVEEELIEFIMKENEQALATLCEPRWVFLDEINTCEHIGLINDIVCHHQCLGKPLAPNLALLAACNPYKLRDKAAIRTAGLENKVKDDEQSKLVYRVHPLPETMVDYVWDYGTLSAEENSDEPAYIERMVGDLCPPKQKDTLVRALVMSQHFIRSTEHNDFCVSLRDVNRFRILYQWFKKTPSSSFSLREQIDDEKRATILALAHVYHSRLSCGEKRSQYRQELARIFQRVWKNMTDKVIFEDIIHREQKGILDMMDMPPGIARNTALQENVFIVLTCILNRMPVFLVGKPGCSKSLSLQLIKSSLRGKDSNHNFFRGLPQLHFVRYQGSESSTSEGIQKVFDKALKYRESIRQQQAKHHDSSNQEDVLPVVILDEIGLAEVSRFNPLKALHSLLEPGHQELPDVAVVGVSNWALDAAKMNRAIHLSRPDMDKHDLFLTGKSISEDILNEESASDVDQKCPLKDNVLEAIANAYDDYRQQLSIENFHGLRDYYSLVKCIARQSVDGCDTIDVVLKGILRNFGGIPAEMGNLFLIFQSHLQKKGISTCNTNEMRTAVRIIELVEENLADTTARHLMLITHGDIALSILKNHLHKGKREFEIILGSNFEEDLKGEYSYRVISRIIRYMEKDVILVLKDLDGIYGSLYDMLNQNYIRIGSKSTCRIALGAYSNQICPVHPNFRCIVLMEERKLNLSDPPFLNRFEKQRLTLEDDQNQKERELCQEIETWLKRLSTFDELPFGLNDLIPIYGPSLVPSLVRSLLNSDATDEFSEQHWKETLLRVMTPEGILRIGHAKDCKDNTQEVSCLTEKFLQLPIHQGLQSFVDSFEQESGDGLQFIVLTHFNPHVDVASCLEKVSAEKIQAERLGNIKSEKMLSDRVEKFWSDPKKEWMIWQCSATSDMGNFLLLKTTLEKHKREFTKEEYKMTRRKHMLLLIHIERSKPCPSLAVLNYLMGWNLAFLDALDEPTTTLEDFLGCSITELVKKRKDVEKLVEREILWGFSRISYVYRERNPASFELVVNAIRRDSDVQKYLEECISKWIQTHEFTKKKDWQQDVACNKNTLHECSEFLSALEQEVEKSLQHPLAAFIFRIEEANAWDALTCSAENTAKKQLWLKYARDPANVDISELKAPVGPGCYKCQTMLEDLHHPFSRVLFGKIERLKDLFKAAQHSMANEDDKEKEGDSCSLSDLEKLSAQSSPHIRQEDKKMMDDPSLGVAEIKDYKHDFIEIALNPYPISMRDLHRKVLSRYIGRVEDLSFPEAVVQLHCSFWFHEETIVPELELIKACCFMTDQDAHLNELLEGSIGESSVDDTTSECTSDVTRATSEHVDIMCYELLPEESRFSCGSTSVLKWHHTVSTVLSLAERVTTTSQSAKCLSVAMNLVSYLGQQSADSPAELQQRLLRLGEVLREERRVDSKQVFDYFVKLVKEKQRTGANPNVQQLFSTYITSCLLEDLEADTSSGFSVVMESIVTEKSQYHGQVFLAPTLHLAFLKALTPSEVLEIVTKEDHELIADTPILQQIDHCLQDLGQDQSPSVVMETPCHMLCMCSDVLQHFVFDDDTFSIKDQKRELHDDIVLDVISDCCACVRNFKFSLRLAMAVAVLKKFIALFGRAALSLKCPHQTLAVVSRLDGFLTIRTEEIEGLNPLQRYFLRVVLDGGGTKTFGSIVDYFKDRITFLRRLTADKKWTALDLVPFSSRLSDSLETSRAALVLSSRGPDDPSMKTRFQSGKFDEREAFQDLAYVCEKYYLPKSHRCLSDTERHSLSKLVRMVRDHVPERLLKVLNFFDGDNKVGKFAMTESMKEEDFQLVSLIMHIIMRLTASSLNKIRDKVKTPFFFKCLDDPRSLNSCFLPGTSEMEGDPPQVAFLAWNLREKNVCIAECKCGTCNAFIGDSSEMKCSSCAKIFEVEKVRDVSLSTPSSQTTRDIEDPAITIRQMSPCSFRILQLMIHGCLLGSLALENCSESGLREFLKLPSNFGLIDYLDENIRTHWRVLQSLTQMGHASLTRFLHIVVEDLLTLPHLEKETAFEAFESKFTTHVNKHVTERFSILQKDVTESSQRLHKQGFELVLEEELEEIDRKLTAPTKNPETASEESQTSQPLLQRLFRETYTPDAEKMKSEFLLQPSVQEDFPFVGLVLSKQSQISLLQHLHPIAAWHVYTVKAISYRFDREECKRIKLAEYLNGLDDSVKESTEKKFEMMKMAWNEVCKHRDLLKVYNGNMDTLRDMEYDSLLCDCIAMDSKSPILQVLKALTEMQNEFLTDALILSLVSKTPALGYFRRREHQSCVAVKRLEFLLPNDVVHVELGDVNFSQICTRHGCGHEIEFDFYHYEMLWGRELLIGKPHLEMGQKFPLIAFSGDLIKSSATLHQEVNELIPQTDVDDKVKAGVKELQKQNPANLRKLQDSLEVMLSLMVRTGGDPKTTAVSYLENWASLLSTPPQEIKSFMKKEQVNLAQITGLLEFVEELQASMVSKTLAKKFRKEVPSKALVQLSETANRMEDARDKIKQLEMLLQALQKFAFRYLSSVGADIKGKLANCVMDPSLWPHTSTFGKHLPPGMSFLPQLLYVEHIHGTIVHLEEEVKQCKAQLSKTWLPKQKESQADQEKKKRDKKLKTFLKR